MHSILSCNHVSKRMYFLVCIWFFCNHFIRIQKCPTICMPRLIMCVGWANNNRSQKIFLKLSLTLLFIIPKFIWTMTILKYRKPFTMTWPIKMKFSPIMIINISIGSINIIILNYNRNCFLRKLIQMAYPCKTLPINPWILLVEIIYIIFIQIV